jgi:hypothetical protein
VEVDVETQATNRATFYISGVCLDCSVTTNLFDSPSSESARQRQGQEVIIVEQDATCLCPENATIFRSPTSEEFDIKLAAILQATSYADGIESIEEKNVVSCEDDTVAFEKVVPIHYDVISELYDDDITLLVAAYEAL